MHSRTEFRTTSILTAVTKHKIEVQVQSHFMLICKNCLLQANYARNECSAMLCLKTIHDATKKKKKSICCKLLGLEVPDLLMH